MLGTEAGPAERGGAELARTQQLPVTQRTFSSAAAWFCQMKPLVVQLPRHMSIASDPQKSTEAWSAVEVTAKSYESAFATTRRVMYLGKGSDRLDHLISSELVELEHFANRKVPPDGTIAPRGYSVYLLLTNVRRPMLLLDAFAHLASQCDKESGLRPTAADARFAVLSGVDVQDFLTSRRHAFPGGVAPRPNKAGEAFLVASDCVSHRSGRAVLRSRCASLLGDAPLEKCLDEMLRALAGMAGQEGEAEAEEAEAPFSAPPAIFFCKRPPPKQSAFVESVAQTSRMFKEMLVAPLQLSFSSFCDTEDFEGKLDWDQVYVRMIPKPHVAKRNVELNDPSCLVGILMHTAERLNEVSEWLQRAREADPNPLFGLPAATRETAQLDLGLHVLYFDVAEVEVGRFLSCYGVGTVPGKRLCSTAQPKQCPILQLQPRMQPLDEALTERYFVLPCSLESALPASYHECDALGGALSSLVRLFCKQVDRKNGDFGQSALAEDRAHHLWRPNSPAASPPLPLGHGLDCPASRLGTVVASLSELKQDCPEALVRMLLAAAAKLGPESCLSEAFEAAREALGRPQTEEVSPREAAPPPQEHTASPEVAPPANATLPRSAARFLPSNLHESDVGAPLHQRSKLIKAFASALGKRKAELVVENVSQACAVEALGESAPAFEVEERVSKVARMLIDDQDDELFLAFRNGVNEVKIFKIDGDKSRLSSTKELRSLSGVNVAICDLGTRLLSFATRAHDVAKSC